MGNGTELSWPMFRDFQDKAPGFDGVVGRVSTSAARRPRAASASAPTARWSRATTSRCSASSPRWAALFTPADDRTPGGHPLAVLGYDYWRRRFAGRADVLGQAIQINGHPFTVIGVAARGFYGLELGHAGDVYVPVTMQPQLGPAWLKIENRRFRWVQVYARLQAGRERSSGRRPGCSRSSAPSSRRRRRRPASSAPRPRRARRSSSRRASGSSTAATARRSCARRWTSRSRS